jgi:uncharacterized protein
MNTIKSLFNMEKAIIGMIHLQALPGTPQNNLKPEKIIQIAVEEAKVYADNGIDAVMIENMHDRPYQKSSAGHEISSLMAIIGFEIKQKTKLICGIQILAGANKEALSVAHSAGLDFIRAEGFVFGHLADEGYIESDAASLLRFRKQIGADNILVFTDIKKKHSSHAITADQTIEEQAHAAEFFLSDGVIITGKSTGMEPNLEEIKNVRHSTKLPVILGSGINSENIVKFYPFADAFIIGSYFKENGNWLNKPNPERIINFLKTFESLKNHY